MKLTKFVAAALGASAITLLTSSAKAADTVVFAAAGSSALWKQVEQGAVQNTGYSNHYSLASGAHIVDPVGLPESGNIWIAWSGTAGNYTIAFDVQVDSSVGDRSFFKRDTVTTTGAAPDNSGYPGSGDTTPPAEVFTAIQNAAINVGLTDITPADAEVATARSIALGYSVTNPIKSDFTTAQADPVPFSISSRPYQEFRFGAAPIMVFINITDTTPLGFGAITTTTGGNPNTEYRSNIDRFTLAGFLSGQLGLTTSLNSDPTLSSPVGGPDNGKSVTVIDREPLSGTYNTIEYCVPESAEISAFTGGLGQELNWPHTATNVSGNGGIRRRAIGTGESIKQAANIPNSLGYAFWSFPNFAASGSKPYGNLRYLTVDGVDPLFDNYSTGSFSPGGAPGEGNLQPTTAPNFRNIKNGGYAIWSILRAVTDVNPASGISNILTNTPSGDFVPYTNLEVFRSYHQTPDSGTPDNGNYGSSSAGGDVGGAVFPINTDVNYTNDTGAELTNLLQ